MTEPGLDLRGDFRVETPEQVSFRVMRAGIGSRVMAALIDSILLTGLYIGLVLAFGAAGYMADLSRWANSDVADEASLWAIGLLIVASMFLFWGYYIGFEAAWNGQTPGKRVLGIRVVGDRGVPATFGMIVIRNLLRAIDLQFGYAVGLVAIFASKEEKRLGDLAAGTIVVSERRRRPTDAVRFGGAKDRGRSVSPELLDLVRDYYERIDDLEAPSRERVAGELAQRLRDELGRGGAPVLRPESELLKLATELMEMER
ncbi:MAG: transporter [Gemmatimonadota bacterium]|nr:MAG: transporter [Gemmatimonadota bacterium]